MLLKFNFAHYKNSSVLGFEEGMRSFIRFIMSNLEILQTHSQHYVMMWQDRSRTRNNGPELAFLVTFEFVRLSVGLYYTNFCHLRYLCEKIAQNCTTLIFAFVFKNLSIKELGIFFFFLYDNFSFFLFVSSRIFFALKNLKAFVILLTWKELHKFSLNSAQIFRGL